VIGAFLGGLAIATLLSILARAVYELHPDTLAVPDELEYATSDEPIAEVARRFRSSGTPLRFAGASIMAAAAFVLGLRGTGLPVGVDLALVSCIGVGLGFVVPDVLVFQRQAAILWRFTRFILLVDAIVRPIITLLDGVAGLFVTGPRPVDVEGDGAARAGVPETPTGALDRVLTLARGDVAEVMTHRHEIIALKRGATIAEVRRLVDSTRHGHYLVCEDEIDRVVGMLRVRDLLAAEADPSTPVDGFVRKVSIVSERHPALDLLLEMQSTGETFAVVIDEFGAVSGVVTHADLGAEIIGRIAEEGERQEFEYERLDRHVWDLSAALKIERVNELTGLGIPDGEYQTLAGFLLERVGRVPRPHEKIEWMDAQFEILAANRRRIVSVRLRLRRRKAREQATAAPK